MSINANRPGAARLVIVIADGLRADVAATAMGYVSALVEAGRARATQYACALPGMSRPLYASLLTGRLPVDHGIVTNEDGESLEWREGDTVPSTDSYCLCRCGQLTNKPFCYGVRASIYIADGLFGLPVFPFNSV